MEHDPLCGHKRSEYVAERGFPRDRAAAWTHPQPCHCDLIAKVRADERERCGREAQQAVAAMPLASFPDGGTQAAVVWRDGWQTGHDAAHREDNIT